MATLKEQDIVLLDHDADGNPIIQMPITRIENVEGAVKTINGDKPDANGNVSVSGKSVGDQWISVDGTIPQGGLTFNGNEISRSIYAELYDYVVAQGRLITESAWQSMYSSNNGNVPYYSSGDGSTTFRLPTFKSYPHFVASGAGTYTKEGLPNVSGNFPGFLNSSHVTGPFSDVGDINMNTGSGTTYHRGDVIQMNLSKANSIYGNSSHVTPESTDVIIGVIALVSSVADGNTSLSDVLEAVEALESRTLKIVRYS